MFTIGTAGHVDHGKSALVKALTGMDPDRLPEEKARGMTLDLGFAWLVLPSGREVSIVDVPGHERFISNMLAGVGGIDLALLVVAADEGIMPQTREHLAILDLLGMQGGVVAITKKDLVEGEWLSLVRDEVEKLLRGTGLEKAPICEVSAFTGEGIPGFIVTLDSLLDSVPPKKDIGRPRLPIDRVFSLSGFGTVVTGTLRDGPLSLGGEVEVVPGGLTGRIRGLQSHKRKLETAYPGSRVGVNLSGLFREALERGQMVAYPGELQATQALDVHLRLLPSAPPLIHNSVHRFFSGTAEVEARVLLLDKKRLEPGGEGWARLRLGKEVAVVRGDRFILRSPPGDPGGRGGARPLPAGPPPGEVLP